MTMRFFIDTNILIYSRDQNDPAKRELAILWLAELAKRDIATINLQVINEITHVILRKFPAMRVEDLRRWIGALRDWGSTPVDEDVVELAWTIRADYGFSWFDCLLLAAADLLGCTHFLSEDLSHGQRVRGLIVVDMTKVSCEAILNGK